MVSLRAKIFRIFVVFSLFLKKRKKTIAFSERAPVKYENQRPQYDLPDLRGEHLTG